MFLATKYFDPTIRHNGSFVKTKGYCTDLFFTAAMGWMKEAQKTKKPFFTYITTNAPHGPLHRAAFQYQTLHRPRLLRQDRRLLYGMIENIDENIGRLMTKLAEWDLEKNTILIFMSDNGMTGGGSGRTGKPLGKDKNGKAMMMFNAGQKGLKGSADEGGVRVPFFIRWKGTLEAGRDISNVAAHIDLYPTLVELAGATIPEKQVEGPQLPPPPQGFQIIPGLIATSSLKKPAGLPDPNQTTTNGRTSPSAATNTVLVDKQLFDMLADPGQKNDIAAKHPEVVGKNARCL